MIIACEKISSSSAPCSSAAVAEKVTWSGHCAVCDEALHRISQGTSVAHTDMGKHGVLDDSGVESMMCREDAIARSKSKKGRFNVTTPAGAGTGLLHRTSLSTCTLLTSSAFCYFHF